VEAENILQEIAQAVRQCTKCSLSNSRKNAVPGDGPAYARIMMIGEGPGHHENEQGLPFVGQAGKFLNELLQAGGYRREDVFITNVVKCRPPGNRDPLPDELSVCQDYLDRQIEAINPLVIVTLGRFSMARYFENAKISLIHGNSVWRDSRLIVPMYHPAAGLHQPNLKPVIMSDFARLPEMIRMVQQAPKKEPPTGNPQVSSSQLSLF
jgi:DNA polymerase